jgi:hypothetical protein
MNIYTVQTNEEANNLLKEHNTNTYVYALIVDDEMVILGEGTGARKKVIFSDETAPGHQKVAIAAFATLIGKKIERKIIPTKSKTESKQLENQLKVQYNFHDMSVYEKNIEYYKKRIEQLNIPENKMFTTLLYPILDAQGSEMAGFKKWINTTEYTETFPGFREYVNKIFGGYYSDL